MLGAQVGLQGRDNGRLGPGAEARQLAQASVLGGAVELSWRMDVQVVVQGVDALRTESRQVMQLGQVCRDLLLEVLQGPTAVAFEDFPNLTGEGLSDSGQAFEVRIFLRQDREFSEQASDLACPIAVGAHAGGILAADFEQIGELLEDPGDIVMLNRHRPRVFAATVRDRVAGSRW
jgi:hypothetical protein